jgi:NRAMP (natural resistance-associated macrophage protein)-like metal ion transporter
MTNTAETKLAAGDEDRRSLAKRISSALGPGVITGAADDDPSGVATYSIAGAQLGTSMLWTALLTWPMMAMVQMMCARIGMVTGEGLAGALRRKLPRPLLVVFAVALLVANTINVAADLAGMADAAAMLTGHTSHLWVVGFGAGIAWATVRLPYHRVARVLKWLALSLFAYVITAFLVHPDWSSILRDAFVPSMPTTRLAWATLVAILGTTISPYLFFWQAAQEVEEEKTLGRVSLLARIGATRREIVDRKIDVGIGTFFSNAVMFFIIVTTAMTLNRHGVVGIETSQQAAQALVPFAGRAAALVYTVGIVGVGLLAIPTLTCSAAYALAETFEWNQGLGAKLLEARAFYAAVLLATLGGVLLDFVSVNAVQAMFWSAVINGVLAPFVLVGVVLVAADAKLMHGQPSSKLSLWVVALTAGVMFAAAIAMFVL